MPLLDWTDFEAETNSVLSDPDGRALADKKANAVLAWSARYCNRLGWARQAYTEFVSPDRYTSLFYLSALPVDTTQSVTVGTYNDATDAYDTYTGSVRKNVHGVVKTGDFLGHGYEAVRVTYTGGYDELPADLKQALTNILVQQVNDAINGGQVVSEVRAIDYTEKYELSGASIPGDALEVLDSYKLPVVA
jgi:hypothetical protein